MEKIKRGWWLYYGIQVAVFSIVMGVYLGVRVLIKEAWGPDIKDWPEVLFLIASTLTMNRAERLAAAACRKAGLPPGGWVSCWLEKSALNEPPVPEPAPIDNPEPSERYYSVCVDESNSGTAVRGSGNLEPVRARLEEFRPGHHGRDHVSWNTCARRAPDYGSASQ